MNNLKRLIWCALLFGIQALYFPLNRYLQGGMEFKTALDDYVPLWSIWAVPYALVCVWWIAAYLWAATVIVVALATLFTHQHYLPDPIGGLALAWFGYRIGLWCVAERDPIRGGMESAEA